MRDSDSPMPDIPPASQQKIIHATLEVGGQQLAGADAMHGHFKAPQGFSVPRNIESTAEAERIFRDLAEAGNMQMPIQKIFWAERFGMTVDRFGTPWMINRDGEK